MKHYLEHDFYVPSPLSSVTSPSDLISHLNHMLGCDISDLSGALLVIGAHVIYFTLEEIFTTFELSTSSISNTLNQLVRRGLLKRGNFTAFDGTSRQYYAITNSGYDIANSYFLGTLPGKYKYGRKENAVSHIYSCGVNFFHALMLQVPFYYQKEVSLGGAAAFSGSRKGIAQADCVLTYRDHAGASDRIFYIEEDLGFERDSVLYEKLCCYLRAGSMNKSCDAILFSFRYKNISVTAPSGQGFGLYSKKGAQYILSLLEENHVQDARELVKDGDPYLLSFLTMVGVYRDGRMIRRSPAITREFLQDFITALSFHRNEYVLRDINRQQCRLYRTRLSRFVSLYFTWIGENRILSELFAYLSGFSVCFIPTCLCSSYLRFLLPRETGLLEDIRRTLLSYYKDIGAYASLSPTIRLEGDLSMRFRNCFPYLSGEAYSGFICVEFPCMDLCSWIRILYFLKLYKGNIPFHILCVFDTQEQVNEFYGYLLCYYGEPALLLDRSIILCTMSYDLGQERRIFTMPDPYGKRAKDRFYHFTSALYEELHPDTGI